LAKESGVEILSVDPNWPGLVVAGRNRPAVLRLSK